MKQKKIKHEEYYIIKEKWMSADWHCPQCTSAQTIKHSPMPRKFVLPKFRERKTLLELAIQRYLCKDCNKVRSSSCPLVAPYTNLSKELHFNIFLQLKEGVSCKYIGNLYGISYKIEEKEIKSAILLKKN